MITTRRALNHYGTVENDARAEFASPYELTKMLFSGALKSLALIPVLMERKSFEECAKEVTRSIGIINGLKDSLDLSQGELAENLFQLYAYMVKELMAAHRNLNQEAVRKVRSLLQEVDEAWSQIPVQYRG
jgi:flagellar protein FliS